MEMVVVRKVKSYRLVELRWLAASTIRVTGAGRHLLWNVVSLPLQHKELRQKWEQILSDGLMVHIPLATDYGIS